jgi:hypothetical protein
MRLGRFAPVFEEDTGSTGSTGSGFEALNNLLNAGGTTPPPQQPPTNTQTPPAQPTQENIQVPPAQVQQNNPPQTPPAQTQVPPQNKQNFAFAQMRTENDKLNNALKKLAQTAGIQYTSVDDLLEKTNNTLAAQQNMPPEMLKRFDQIEELTRNYQMEQYKQAAFVGFQRVKDEHGLTEDELRAFAQELDSVGKNPFTTPVDLNEEYWSMHRAEIIDKRVKAAVEEALKASGAADTHSTTPNSATGTNNDGKPGQQITTIAGLDAFLDGVNVTK